MEDYILELDKPRKLRYNFRALRLLREKFAGKSTEELMEIVIDQIPTFVWAGLVWEDKDLTPERIEELLDEKVPEQYTMMAVVELIGDAMTTQLGIPVDVKGGSPGPFDKTRTASSATPDESPSKSG